MKSFEFNNTFISYDPNNASEEEMKELSQACLKPGQFPLNIFFPAEGKWLFFQTSQKKLHWEEWIANTSLAAERIVKTLN